MWIVAWELISIGRAYLLRYGSYISLLCPQLVRMVLTLFLNIHSLMLLHANGTNWVNISKHQIFIVSGRVLNNVIYTTIWMLIVNNNLSIIVISVVSTVNYCKWIVLLYPPLNFMYIWYWTLNIIIIVHFCSVYADCKSILTFLVDCFVNP